MSDRNEPRTVVDCQDVAEAVGLSYATSDDPGLTRRRAGNGFSYRAANGARVSDRAVLSRIRALAIPPAWVGVWICPDPNGHIQAVGQDEKGRKQYRYHDKFRGMRGQRSGWAKIGCPSPISAAR